MIVQSALSTDREMSVFEIDVNEIQIFLLQFDMLDA